jgi:hypothetical protein
MLEHPTAVNFCNLIMNGEWDEAERALNSLLPIMEEANTNVTVRRIFSLIVINNQHKPKTKLFSFK